jgi:sirohydrochlorin ferrochelatase
MSLALVRSAGRAAALLFAFALPAAGALAAHPPSAQAPSPAGPAVPGAEVGTIVVAHGGGADWNAQVEAVVKEVRLPGPVAVSFLMGPGAKAHRFQDAVQDLVRRGAKQIVVVPMLVSSHSGHYDQIRYLARQLDTLGGTMMHHLHMAGIDRAPAGIPIRLTPAMDDAPQVAEVLAARARALAKAPSKQALFIVGHGPNAAEDYAAWMSNLRRVADTVRARTGFRSVLVDLVRDDAPAPVRAEAVTRVRELVRLQHELTGREVVVVPVLVSTGTVSREKLPKDLAGLPMVYAGEALLPHPGMARWIEARVRGAAAPVAGAS